VKGTLPMHGPEDYARVTDKPEVGRHLTITGRSLNWTGQWTTRRFCISWD